MTLRLPLSGKRHVTILSAYAPIMTNPDEVKDKFYDDLDSVISATPRTEKLILLGDINARVGTDHQTGEGVIGTEGVGKCNNNGLHLVRKCAEHDHQHSLPSTNSQQVTMDAPLLQTLASHCHSAKVSEGQRLCVVEIVGQVTSLLSGTICIFSLFSDHKAKKCQRDWNFKLKQNIKRQAFINDICSRLDALEHSSDDLDENWTVFRDTVYCSATDSLGQVSRKYQDWFDKNNEEIQGNLEEEH